ncbi:unnamed protein product, partial [Meganyctiphanes norvegica]
WGGFPVPLMDLSVSSDMQEMMSQLDHGGGNFGSSMDFMKLPSRGDQKSLSITSLGETPIQIDYGDVEADIPPIPMALKGALEIINYDESQEEIKEANKDDYEQSYTEEVFDIQPPDCDHGFCEEESLNADDK